MNQRWNKAILKIIWTMLTLASHMLKLERKMIWTNKAVAWTLKGGTKWEESCSIWCLHYKWRKMSNQYSMLVSQKTWQKEQIKLKSRIRKQIIKAEIMSWSYKMSTEYQWNQDH